MSDIADKIKKLMAKARDAAAGEAEALTCAEKARKLMEEHGLDESVLEERGVIGPHTVNPKYIDPWRRQIIIQCSRLYGCEAVFYKGGSVNRYDIIGREAGATVAASMIQFLDDEVRRLALAARREAGGDRRYLLAFERGCGTRIAGRLYEMREASESKAKVEGTGLVLLKEYQQVQAWMGEHMQTTSSKGRGSKLVGEGARAGIAAGNKVHLGGRVSGASGPRLLA